MRKLNGHLPTEMDMNQTHIEINILSQRNDNLLVQLQNPLDTQMQSAENQLRVIRGELADPILFAGLQSKILRQLINKQWETLSATLTMARMYYV